MTKNKPIAKEVVDVLSSFRLPSYLLQGSGIGTWAWNVQSGETRFDEHWAEILGYSLEELQPSTIATWERLIHPEDKPVVYADMERHFRGETPYYEVEIRMRHKDGHWVHILDHGRLLIRDDQDKPLWVFGSHLDISKRWHLEQQNKELIERFNRLVAHLPGYVYQFRLRADGSSHFPFTTPAIREVYGCGPDDVLNDATDVFNVIYPDDLERVRDSILYSAEHLTEWRERYRVNHPSKGLIWVEGNSTPERESDGATIWHGYLQDVTEDQRQRDQLLLASTVFSSSQEGIIITDANNIMLDINDAVGRITGYSREELLGKNPAVLSSGKQGPGFYVQMWEAIRRDGRWRGEISNRRKDGSVYVELLSIDAVRDTAGSIRNYIAIFTDISQIKEHQNELNRIAHYDALTGLPNRRLLEDRIEMAMEHVNRHEDLLAVCFLDLDNFKEINDKHGHELGDQVLVQVANTIRSALRGHDTVARIGGDEFVLLLTELENRAALLGVVGRVLEAIQQPIVPEDGNHRLSASVGIAVYPELDCSADELLRYADQAMYRAKQRGRNQYYLFDAEEDQMGRERQSLLHEIEQALADNAFTLYYQPKINLHSGVAESVEALIRWPQEDGSVRMPDTFIPQLYGLPIERRLGCWVLDRAIRQYSEWMQAGLTLSVSMNVSPEHLLFTDFVSQLRSILATHRIVHPENIVLEILETSRISDFQRMRERVIECRALGVRTSLDDFGTGYSSLTYMRQLPVDELKIDKSFVMGMLGNAEDRSIVRGIIALGHAFHRSVVAEGAETPRHLTELHGMGCDFVQGYSIARAMPAQDIPAWVSAWVFDPDAVPGHDSRD
ncbi:MAG: EAL domain-containing protein [Gammaproteobacteria bacterium]